MIFGLKKTFDLPNVKQQRYSFLGIDHKPVLYMKPN